MKLNKIINLKNENSIKKCMDYTDQQRELNELLKEVEIIATFKGLEKKWSEKEQMKFEIEIKRGKNKTTFDFYQSIYFSNLFIVEEFGIYTEKRINDKIYTLQSLEREKKKEIEGFLYSVLCCIKSDGFIPDNFTDFCYEFGYNEDSIKDSKLFLECLEQKKKIKKIFTEKELEFLPS